MESDRNQRSLIFIYFYLLTLFLPAFGGRCTHRKVYTGKNGTIEDGSDMYSPFSRCEWLIDAGSSKNSIVLEFKAMDTECSYDFIFVHDGNSHESPLLASLSGDTLPKTIIAKSGYMLIFFFTDRNYERQGFKANYMVQSCPFNCHGNGICSDHKCYCENKYIGESCEFEICPNDCSGNGECFTKRNNTGCKCNGGYLGVACDLAVLDNTGSRNWYNLLHGNPNFSGRTSHSGVFVKSTQCLYVFGGYNLNVALDDLVRFCLEENSWEVVKKQEPWPSPRRDHAMVEIDNGFYILGGILENGSQTNELWFYNLSSDSWSLKALNSTLTLPCLKDHSFTVAQEWIYVIGGKSQEGIYSPNIYRINASQAEEWEDVHVTGGRKPERFLSGHSALYHPESKSILIYGGYTTRRARYSHLSNKLFAFNTVNSFWSQIHFHYIDKTYMPKQRAHHSAVIMGNYMVIYGGNVHIHNHLETCYDPGIYMYHLGCHQWVKHPLVHGMSTGLPPKGRFGHVAVSVQGNIMLVAGGYSGHVHNDLLAYKFPSVVAPPEFEVLQDKDYCLEYNDKQQCVDDLECAFCNERRDISRPGCIHRTRTEMCSSPIDYYTTPCQGICSLLSTCETCLTQGQGVYLNPVSPMRRYYQEECLWCVKNSTCQRKAVPEGTCQSPDGTKSGIQGWWEGLSSKWTDVDECSTYDIPGGVRAVKYFDPADMSFPDEVEILGEIETTVNSEILRERKIKEGGFWMTHVKGFIYPLNAQPVEGTDRLEVFLFVHKSSAILNISKNSSVIAQEQVAALGNSDTEKKEEAVRENNTPIFSNIARGYKYYFKLETNKLISEESNSSVAVKWNSGGKEWTSRTNFYTISKEFLEQYHTDNCTQYTTCLACLTDASCAWCHVDSTCYIKGSNSSKCTGPQPIEYLVTAPSYCSVCADYVDCQSCNKDDLCEWVLGKEKCVRRGRIFDFRQRSSSCAVPCHMRKNCTSCITEKNVCFWCENMGVCLPFAHYITLYIHGECREWVDDEGRDTYTCPECSQHVTFTTCLSHYGCGWCGNEDNPSIGKCVAGDYKGPFGDKNCSVLISQFHNVSSLTLSSWSYHTAPKVNECALGFHNCNENATCIDTDDAYECKCKRGYFGDGKYCFQTCYYECTYGKCSGSPDFTCNCKLGWTGNDCNTSCGCNLQSTCNTGVGICDKCQNNTEGKYCQMCKPGYFGIPASIRGCQKCNCNGHGDIELGLCNNVTSECYCIHNTNGTNCEKCLDGYYGNPRNGSKCFRKCENKVVLNQTVGSLGYYEGDGHCLWIISPNSEDVLTKLELEDRSTITLQFDALDTSCGKEYVYIYDGIPDFIDGSKDARGYLLGAFCGNSIEDKIMAKSGIMIVYAQPDSGMKFNASYVINECSEDCLMKQNQFCHINQCQCDPGLKGNNCDSIACPAHCTVGKFKESCICHSGYGASNYTAEIFPWSIPTMLQTTGFPGELNRYGHTLVNCGGNDVLYLFGGFSLKHGPMNDLWMYNISHQRWSKITAVTDDQPTGRYYHSTVCLPYLKMFYVFGGFVKSHDGQQKYRATNEFWRFSIGPRKWSNQSIPSWLQPVGGHTLTQIADTRMIVIGGFSTENYFSDQMYEYDANSIHETGQAGESSTFGWKKFGRKNVDGTIPVGFYGHSAVYHSITNSLFIYGGMIYRQGAFFASSELFAVDLDYDKHWYILQAEERSQREPRYLHTAVSVGDYMVVIGGLTSKHGNKSDGILLYRYLCNFWHRFKIQGISLVKSFTGLVGTTAVAVNNSIFIMGGLDNTAHNQVIRLDLPQDICSLISELDQCLNASGCSACIVSLPGGKNRTYCYSNNQPAPSSCEGEEPILVTGEQCSLQWHLERMCKKYETCSSCLAVFPHFKHARQTCQWCSKCNGIHSKRRCFHCTGLCTGTSCTDCFNVPTNGITSTASGCTESRGCQAADCEKCTSMTSCIWTREIQILNAYRRNIYTSQANWNCFSDSYKENNISSSPHDMCPDKCYMHKDCTSCLKSFGGEGGSIECKWSSALRECMSPAYVLFRCAGGECGLILEGHSSKCPLPCWNHTWCSNCLQAPGCGWCAFGGFHGRGVCMDGGINTPTGGFCRQDNISLIHGKLTDEQERYRWRANPEWHYLQCPPENECKNNHHTCDSETQDCKDSLEGYDCTCKEGYVHVFKKEYMTCRPVCHNQCDHGYCAKPEYCVCDFGWVGAKCDVECQCNGHSNCRSVERKDECLECHNNTKGRHCEMCKPLFVGDPKKNIKCVSCLQHCNNHTRICVDKDMRYNTSSVFPPSIEILNNENVVLRGPVPGNAVCIGCRDNTEGTRCESCVSGHFRVKSEGHNLTHPCLKCQCHGHSVTCNVDTGEGCRCGNNTETRCTKQSDDVGGEKCWQKQCSACKEYFLGTPTNKHQCYRQMSVDKDYCLDPETQNQCSHPSPLGLHRTVFFFVQPKYLNVDIRITIDITQGGADVYFSSNDKTFIVNVNEYTGVHEVELDPIFDISEHNMPHYHLKKRSVSNITSREQHDLLQIRADGFHTYYTLLETSNILIVRDVQRRLVITLPLESHDLQKSKFFIILRGKGDSESTKTYGTLYFRQDQPHIDLFVFFSVFFSSFFLFLSMCVLLWKLKQAFDAQRSRQLRAKEMLHMASRPFAKVLVLIEPDLMPHSSTPVPRRTKVQKFPSRNLPPLPLPQNNNIHMPFYFPIKSCPFDITPIAMEPTDDGIASVRTAIIQLPGGPLAPTKLCLGSSLTTSCRTNLTGTKATVRRRPSSTAC